MGSFVSLALLALVLWSTRPAQAENKAGAQLDVVVSVVRSCRVVANASATVIGTGMRAGALLSTARESLAASCGADVQARVTVATATLPRGAENVLDVEF